MSQPVVTVVIPCYNQGDYLDGAIKSVVSQTYPHVEVVVVNDGSTDNTAAVAEVHRDYVVYLSKANAGLSAARNSGILASSGDMLLFLDADDYLDPYMLEAVVEESVQNPDVDVFCTACLWVDPAGEVVRHKRAKRLDGDPLESLLRANPFQTCQIVVRRAALANSGLFDVTLQAVEDWDLWIRLGLAGASFAPVPGAVSVYRRHPGSMSGNYPRMKRAGQQLFRKLEAVGMKSRYPDALKEGRRHYRGYCFSRLLRSAKSAGVLRGLAMCVREASHDPRLAITLVHYSLKVAHFRLSARVRGAYL